MTGLMHRSKILGILPRFQYADLIAERRGYSAGRHYRSGKGPSRQMPKIPKRPSYRDHFAKRQHFLPPTEFRKLLAFNIEVRLA
jgi:hypothetical protein